MLKPHLDKSEDIALDILQNMTDTGQREPNHTLTRVVNRLVAEHSFKMEDARSAAAKAIAEHDSRHVDGFIDLDNSTSKALFVKIEGHTRVLSLAQINKFFE